MGKEYLNLEINDKKYKLPTSWNSLTLEQYCRMFFNLPNAIADEDDVMLIRRVRETESIILSRLLGEEDDFCLNLPINVYLKLVDKIKYIYDIDFLKKNSKAGIVIDGKRYSVPPFNEMSLRQYIDADVIIKDKENPMQYIELLAILLTEKDKNGKWIPYKGEYQELMGKLRAIPCSEALGIAYHFFKKGEILKKVSEVSMKVEALNQQRQLIQSS